MGKKRKSIASSLDEVDRTMYTTFCSAANSLSQLYTQAMNHQKLSFQAGERHGLNEIEYGEEPSMSPRAPPLQQPSQPTMHFTNSAMLLPPGSSGLATTAHGPRSEHGDHQPKNSVFSNALSSPVRRSLQHYHIPQGGYFPSGGVVPGNGVRNNESNMFQQQNRDSNPLSSNDSSMDMHADSPGHESNY
ncbi:hypothetical protein RJ641_031753 [Dillenia turbinata]|uniref:Uncharacterized protein n=1 Tax=Dillenia turbinata TaxID=194707 RepID=A0AAN8VQ80_9MAGN